MDTQFWSIERAAGLFLVLGVVAVFPGLMMFWIRWIRAGHRGGAPPTRAYYLWERGFVMAAIVITAVGFVLLEGSLASSAGRVLARAGATVYLFGGILGVAAEALNLADKDRYFFPLVVVYVSLAFLAQVAIGGALLQAGLLPAWVGWVTIVWNIAWFVVVVLFSPRDLYFPILHHAMPLLIGIGLLLRQAA